MPLIYARIMHCVYNCSAIVTSFIHDLFSMQTIKTAPLFLSRTIKPLVKKSDEEVKREPSPELAKISALVTRPPKQKSTSKKTEEGILDGSPALPTDSFSANLTSVPPASTPRTKKSIYQNEPSPHFDHTPKLPNPLAMQQQVPYYFVSTFVTIFMQWGNLLKFSFELGRILGTCYEHR